MSKRKAKATSDDRLRKRIMDLVNRYGGKLLLYGWNVEVCWDDKIENAAEAKVQPEYRFAKLTFNIKELRNYGHRHTQWIVWHELAHVLTWETTEYAERWAGTDSERVEVVRRAVEGMVSWLASALVDLEDPEKA